MVSSSPEPSRSLAQHLAHGRGQKKVLSFKDLFFWKREEAYANSQVRIRRASEMLMVTSL